MNNTVMAFGVFDYLTDWKINYLKEAKKYGDVLVVVILNDKKTKDIKGELPINNEDTRVKMIEELGLADIVEVSNKINSFKSISKYRPSVIAIHKTNINLIYEIGEYLFENQIKTNILTIEKNEKYNGKYILEELKQKTFKP